MRRLFTASAIMLGLISFAGQPARAALVNFWSFNGSGVDTVGGNSANLTGTASYSCSVPSSSACALTTGTNGSAVTAGNITLGNTFSVIGWIYASSLPTYEVLVADGPAGFGSPGFRLLAPLSSCCHYAQFETSGGPVIGSANINLNQWHQIGLTYAGGNTSLYVDGTLDATGTTLINPTNGPFSFGAAVSSGSNYGGYIQDVALYSTALTGSQISAAYVQGQGGTPFGFVAVPEPASLVLFGAGLVGLGLARRRLLSGN